MNSHIENPGVSVPWACESVAVTWFKCKETFASPLIHLYTRSQLSDD
jgi:hypothetical protein